MTLAGIAVALLGIAVAGEAQPLGSFTWQLQPFCNRVTVNVRQDGGIYTLDGFDDQCGAPRRTPVTGLATPNPDGTITFGLSAVAVDGRPLHIEARIQLPGLSGTWADSAGQSGSFAFGASSGGALRPVTGLGAAAIDASQVQRRVSAGCAAGEAVREIGQDGAVTCEPVAGGAGGDITGVLAGTGLSGGGTIGEVALAVDASAVQMRVAGACGAGQAMRGINQDGTVLCEPVPPGDITAVTAGTGLSGGGAIGNISLAVQFAGSGAATTVARSDHNHQLSSNNAAIGLNALASGAGARNVAAGQNALEINSGSDNTGLGVNALRVNAGDDNTAVGQSALVGNTSGSLNTAVGDNALGQNSTGERNTGVGRAALNSLTTGTNNVGIGANAGQNLSSGSHNIYIGAFAGSTDENNTLRIGTTGVVNPVTRAFIGGIRGVTTGLSAIPVVVDGFGQLGTVSSSRRYKENIVDLPDLSGAVQRLRPVQFTYKQRRPDGTTPVQFGLIAEEVEQIMPTLVEYGADGQVLTVHYEVLPTLLLAEVQRLERERAELKRDVAAAQSQVQALGARLAALEAGGASRR